MKRLADVVAQRISEVSYSAVEESAELRRAEELSDLFSDVVPEAYVLPLDALAGFSSTPERNGSSVDGAIEILS